MSKTNIVDEAAEWLVSLRDGGLDAAERSEFTAWLCKSPEHVRAYLELTSVWAESAGVDDQHQVDVDALLARASADSNVIAFGNGSGDLVVATAKPSGKPKARRWLERRPQLIAACAAVLCFIVVGAWWQANQAQTYATGIGEQRLLTLVDGSRVELNARSRIRVRFSDQQRYVDLLEGQGMFQVAKDKHRPFIVRSGKTSVRAVGTQFDVYRKSSGTVVTVLEGKVEVQSGAASGPDMPPGDSISALVAGEQVIVTAERIDRATSANIAAATAWTQRQLVFDSAALAEVAHEFNRYNLRQLIISDAQLEDFLISGVFSSTDPGSLLRFLQQQSEFVVQETDTEIRISRRE